jgi:hypothetical protein
LQSVQRETMALRSRIEAAPAGNMKDKAAYSSAPESTPISDPDADRRAAEALLETVPDRPRPTTSATTKATPKKKPPPAPVAKSKTQEGFTADPCQGDAAQFMSTCKR